MAMKPEATKSKIDFSKQFITRKETSCYCFLKKKKNNLKFITHIKSHILIMIKYFEAIFFSRK